MKQSLRNAMAFRRAYLWLIVSGLIIMFAAPFGRMVSYQVEVPYQTTETKYKGWGGIDTVIQPRGYTILPMNQTYYLKSRLLIKADANITRLLMINDSNYTAFQKGQHWQPDLSVDVAGPMNFSYVPRPYERSYIRVDNLSSVAQPVRIDVKLQYEETVTRYRTETRFRFEPDLGSWGTPLTAAGLFGAVVVRYQQPLLGAGLAFAWILLIYAFFVGWIPFNAQNNLSVSVVAASTIILLAMEYWGKIWKKFRNLLTKKAKKEAAPTEEKKPS